jgi:dihydrofolate reductase
MQERVMTKLIYASNMSLDGCTEDERGAFDWAPPDDDVFVYITELMRSAGTYLYGRRMYETLAVWETDPALAEKSGHMANYASVWQAADKIVYSSTLAGPLTANTRLERRFDPGAADRYALRSEDHRRAAVRQRRNLLSLSYSVTTQGRPVLQRYQPRSPIQCDSIDSLSLVSITQSHTTNHIADDVMASITSGISSRPA